MNRILHVAIFAFGVLTATRSYAFDTAPASESLRQWEVGVGPAFVNAANTPYVITGWRFGYLYQPQPLFDIQGILDWAISNTNTDSHFFRAALASDYFFSAEPTAPFATVDAGYASVHAHHNCNDASCEAPSDDAAGFTLGLGGGMKFRRQSCVSFGVLAHYGIVFATTRYGTPGEYSLTGLVYF